MFGVTAGDEEESNNLLEEFVEIQSVLFSNLNLHFKLVSMG